MNLSNFISGLALFATVNGALTQVRDFGSNPAGIEMWIEVPGNVAPEAPIIVAVSAVNSKEKIWSVKHMLTILISSTAATALPNATTKKVIYLR